mgnify:CR=1 FL=1
MGFIQVAYFILGVFQFFALWSGIEIWLGVNSFFSGILAFFLAGVPIVGTALGMYGAVAAWGWSWIQAGALFFLPFISIVIAAFLSRD